MKPCHENNGPAIYVGLLGRERAQSFVLMFTRQWNIGQLLQHF